MNYYINLLLILFGSILLGIFSASMESKTYNKLTGANTTWFDALWVELRVEHNPHRQSSIDNP
jgi:hypothetical protein